MGLYQKVLEEGHQLDAVSVFSPSRIEVQISGSYLTLRRRILDSLMVEKALESGAVLHHGSVDDVSIEQDGLIKFSISENGGAFHANVGVIATGANASLARKLGMITDQKPGALAIRCYARSTLNLDRMVVSYDRAIIPGYAWIFPMGNDEYNMGCGLMYRGDSRDHINLRKTFSLFINEFPLAKQLMNMGEIISPLRGAMLRAGLEGAQPIGKGNILAIGETIGSTFPYTGAGIGKAMETGELAAEVIHEALGSGDFARLREFPIRLDRELKPRYLGYQIAQKWLSRAWLNDLVARRTLKSQFLRDSFTGINDETVDPRTVFSLRGIIKSLLK
jgi:flavin-dependent dehydrogenase